MLRPKPTTPVTNRPNVPLHREPAHVSGHVTSEGSVVAPYESHRNRLPQTANEPKHRNFAELAANEEASSYKVEAVPRENSKYGIFGIHAGKLSSVVSYLTDKIAGNDFTKYLFKADKARGNRTLMLQGSKFDETEAVRLAGRTPVVVSLAISDQKGRSILVDGRNEHLADELTQSLKGAGFSVKKPFQSHLNGRRLTNIANLGALRQGVQIQLPKDLRADLTTEIDTGTAANPDSLSSKFTGAVRTVLNRVEPAESVEKTKAQIRASGRIRNDHSYIGEFSDLATDKKEMIAASIIQTNNLRGMSPEGLSKSINRNTAFVAFDKDSNSLKSVAGLKKLKDTIQNKIMGVYEGSDSDSRAQLLVDRRELSEFMGNIERGHAVEYGWASNPSGDKASFKKVLNLLFTDAEKKGYGANSIFSVVRSDNEHGHRHAQNLGMKPVMKFASPYGEEPVNILRSELTLFVYKGRRR